MELLIVDVIMSGRLQTSSFYNEFCVLEFGSQSRSLEVHLVGTTCYGHPNIIFAIILRVYSGIQFLHAELQIPNLRGVRSWASSSLHCSNL